MIVQTPSTQPSTDVNELDSYVPEEVLEKALDHLHALSMSPSCHVHLNEVLSCSVALPAVVLSAGQDIYKSAVWLSC